MTRTLFVTATGTEVGKTFVACALIRALVRRGTPIDAFKPVLSGFTAAAESDAGLLLHALGRPLIELARMSPLRFAAALAPPSAARAEGVRLELQTLVALCRERMTGPLIIEGAGGVMSPIAEDGTNLDLIAALQVPAVLVTGSYLGAVSHTLTAIEAIRARNLAVAAIVVSESGGDHPPITEIDGALDHFAGKIPRFIASRNANFDAAPLAKALYGGA